MENHVSRCRSFGDETALAACTGVGTRSSAQEKIAALQVVDPIKAKLVTEAFLARRF